MSAEDVLIDDNDQVSRVLTLTETLLLDFDGPVCSVFAGFPASEVANQLREILDEGGLASISVEIEKTEDPFEVFAYAASFGEAEAGYAELALRAHELEAIKTAEPTPGAHEIVERWSALGRKIVIVSNNSTDAVKAYLELHRLAGHIVEVSAREESNPELLKPNPYLVSQAMAKVGAKPSASLLVGDSASDLEAARAAGVRSVAYANKLWKVDEFKRRKPSALVTRMETILAVLRHGLE